MRYFADHGYESARIADIAAELGIAKGSVFQHFISKDGLFLETYKQALQALPSYLDVPDSVKEKGFFAVVRHRLQNSDHIRERHPSEYRVVVLGNYGSDLALKKRINRFVQEKDPMQLNALVRMGLDRGELRHDVDALLIASVLQSTLERFQDSLLMATEDPELFNHTRSDQSKAPEQHIDEFMRVLQDAIGNGA